MRGARLFAACLCLVALTADGCGSDGGKDGDDPGHTPGKPGSPGSGGTGGSTDPNVEPGAQPAQGATDFVSADTGGGQNGVGGRTGAAAPSGAAGNFANAAADSAEGGAASTPRTVERGDVYRVLDDGRLLNLNAYRGLQVIDIRDLSAPVVEGRLAAAGTPVEMYVVGDRAIVLLNDWQGYYGTRDDVKVESVQGGLVMNVDISDRSNPVLLAQHTVRGNITTSRLTQGGGKAALYVAANEYQQEPPYGNTTVVDSFDVSGDAITEKSELDLGGYVQDIQATTDVLLVAGQDWQTNSNRSTVSVIDISSPDGTMVQGDTVLAQGYVGNKFNMDVRGDVLRVVSGDNWSGSNDNALETFDISDLSNITAIDTCSFSDGQALYATIFLEDRAFFVTYLRKDPFHAFTIDAQGNCQEHAEYVVSGWNDFLRPTLGDSRLVGIGRNDEANTSKMSVSLYDTTDVNNKNPLIARADVDLTYSYSQAQWDDRAFSVLEDAVSVKAPDGTLEKGLVLLPYEGWDQKNQQYLAQVQILTFSDTTLTLRGTMDHGSSVNRSFLTSPATAGNLSDEQLSLFDTSNPDSPKELGRVDVAPSYSQLFVYGDYVARVKDRGYYFGWNGNQSVEPPKSKVEILARSGDLDGRDVIASLDVPAGADLIQSGDLLVSVSTQTTYDPQGIKMPEYHSTVQVYDLSDPSKPRARGSLETDRLRPGYYGYYGFEGDIAIDCFNCGRGGYYPYWGGGQTTHYVLGDAIVFVSTEQQQKSLGVVHQCYTNPPYQGCAVSSDGTTSDCPDIQYAGGINCSTPKGGKESCSGQILECSMSKQACTPMDAPPAGSQTSCSDYEQFRYWQSYAFDALDVSNPDALVLAPSVKMDKNEEGTSVLAAGTQLYFNFQQPYVVSGDSRSHVKHFFRALDFADPQQAGVGDAVNVPGDVIESSGDIIYTRDLVWNDTDTRTLVARLELSDGLAHLQASRVFADRAVSAVRLDGAGAMLVSSDPAYSYYGYYARQPDEQPQHTLSILDATSLKTIGETDVDAWATFQDAKQGRALFSVSGGLLVFNVQDAAHPTAQAYFPTVGWPQSMLFDGNEIVFAAGPYGVYRFDADVYNLLSK